MRIVVWHLLYLAVLAVAIALFHITFLIVIPLIIGDLAHGSIAPIAIAGKNIDIPLQTTIDVLGFLLAWIDGPALILLSLVSVLFVKKVYCPWLWGMGVILAMDSGYLIVGFREQLRLSDSPKLIVIALATFVCFQLILYMSSFLVLRRVGPRLQSALRRLFRRSDQQNNRMLAV